MIKQIDNNKILEEFNKCNIKYIKVFYKKYRKYIANEFPKDDNLNRIKFTIIFESILKINSNAANVEDIINDNIKLVKENKLPLRNFEYMEDLQKAVLSKWINSENPSFAYVFYSAPLNMVYDGFFVTLQSIIIRENIIEITQYGRDFEVFYFSDYKMPYVSTINNIQKIGGVNNIVITFKDGFRFSAIPNNDYEDSRKIEELKNILSAKVK